MGDDSLVPRHSDRALALRTELAWLRGDRDILPLFVCRCWTRSAGCRSPSASPTSLLIVLPVQVEASPQFARTSGSRSVRTPPPSSPKGP
jgi:hypothetical protein